MIIFEIVGKILDFIRNIFIGIVIFLILFVVGGFFLAIVLTDSFLNLFNKKESKQITNDYIDD